MEQDFNSMLKPLEKVISLQTMTFEERQRIIEQIVECRERAKEDIVEAKFKLVMLILKFRRQQFREIAEALQGAIKKREALEKKIQLIEKKINEFRSKSNYKSSKTEIAN